ncbi:MAG: L,D-transpeptidase family protein [Paracoccus sp. (in: a-proteobacteria)]|nr:L,D-transpeptidase family protein [Paracoccus sp. (in: a-proteobacteria)]
MSRRRRLLQILLLIAILALIWAMFGARLFAPAPAPRPPLPRPDISAPLQGQIDRLVIEKAARRMSAWQNGRMVREYRVALGFAPDGDKMRQGDGKTPEGIFRIDRRNDRSRFHLSLGIDYPRAADRARARAGGYDPGGDIFIHGQPNEIAAGFRVAGDWTDGCIAIDNHEIEELFAATPIGAQVEIRP